MMTAALPTPFRPETVREPRRYRFNWRERPDGSVICGNVVLRPVARADRDRPVWCIFLVDESGAEVPYQRANSPWGYGSLWTAKIGVRHIAAKRGGLK